MCFNLFLVVFVCLFVCLFALGGFVYVVGVFLVLLSSYFCC